MENNLVIKNSKLKKNIKYPEISLSDSDSDQLFSAKIRSKTYENNSFDKEDRDENKGILLINSMYLKNALNKNLPKSTKKHNKKEILYKYINHSYFKDSLGSIPGKSEIILLDNKHKKKDRFSFNEPTFNKIKDNIPGVGTYNLEYDWNLKNNGINMDMRIVKRFKNRKKRKKLLKNKLMRKRKQDMKPSLR